MNTRFQGSICLTLGLLGLAGYLFTAGGTAEQSSFSVPATGPVLVPFAGDSWQITYWGTSTERFPSETRKTTWTITLFGLPQDSEQNRTVLISCIGQPLTTKDLGAELDPETRGTFVMQVDKQGNLHEMVTPFDFDVTSFPVDLLLNPNPRVTERDVTAGTPNIGLSLGNKLSMQAVSSSLEDRSCSYNVVGKIPALELNGGNRRLQLDYDFDSVYPQQLLAQTSFRERGEDVRTSFKLRWGHTGKITQDRVLAMRGDLDRWFSYDTRVKTEMRAASEGVSPAGVPYGVGLATGFSELKSSVSLCSDSLTKDLLDQFSTSPGISYHRVQLGFDGLRRILPKHSSLQWRATSLDGGVYEQSDFQHKITVLGFVYCGKSETLRATEILCDLRRKFSSCDVEVIAFCTDKEPTERQRLANAMDPEIKVVDGQSVASKLELFQCGVPVVIVCDRQGQLRILHACQSPATSDILTDQIKALLDESQAIQTALGQVDHPSFASRSVNRFDDLHASTAFVAVD